VRGIRVTAARIATALAELAALHEQLGQLVWATRPAGHAPPGPRTPDLDAVDARYAIVNSLTTWFRVVQDHWPSLRPPAGYLDPAVGLLTARLTDWATWIEGEPWALDLEQDLAAVTAQARAVLARGDVAVVPVCGCPETGCAGTVRARVDRTAALLPTVLVCSVDRAHRWGAGEWRELARGMRARWLLADEVAAMLGTSVTAVWQMAHRRGWRRTGTRPTGYLASDVAGLTSGAMEAVG
jgi:hypothetical protein